MEKSRSMGGARHHHPSDPPPPPPPSKHTRRRSPKVVTGNGVGVTNGDADFAERSRYNVPKQVFSHIKKQGPAARSYNCPENIAQRCLYFASMGTRIGHVAGPLKYGPQNFPIGW